MRPILLFELREYFDAGIYGDLDFQKNYRGEPNATKDAVIKGSFLYIDYDEFGRKTYERLEEIPWKPWPWSTYRGYYNFDEHGRPEKIYFPGVTSTYEETLMGCCGPDQVTARDGTVTQYTYDERGMKIGETAPGAGFDGSAWIDYSYNANGQLLTEGLSGEPSPLKSYAYGLDGSLIAETNALGGVTTYIESFDSLDQRYTKTTTYPDGGTRVERHYLDGRLERITGTAVAPQRFEYTVEQLNSIWCRSTKTIALDAVGNDTLQWEKTYIDAIGRTIRKEFAAPTTPYPYDETTYNNLGQRVAHRDPDGVTTLFAYDGMGQLEYQAIDMDLDGILDLDGTDRVTRDVIATDGGENQEVLTNALETDGSTTETLIRESTRSGYTSTEAEFIHQDTTTGINRSTSATYDPPNRSRTTTTVHSDLTQTKQIYTDGLLRTVQTLDGSSQVIHQVDYTYDAQDRLHTQTTWQDHAGAMGAAVTRWNYDPYRGWLTSKDHPDPNTGQAPLVEGSNGPNYTYTPAGRQASRTWLRGVVTTYTHNAAGEVSHIGYSDTTPSVTYTHDRRGRLASVSRDGIITSYTYNLAGQVLNEGHTGGTLDGLALSLKPLIPQVTEHKLNSTKAPPVSVLSIMSGTPPPAVDSTPSVTKEKR